MSPAPVTTTELARVPVEPEPIDKPLPLGTVSASGRLEPKLIQNIVRGHYRNIRKCYEAGLGRNGHLRGRVTARFVIGRDGKVSAVSNGGSDIPDPEVVTCILEYFRAMTFPKPEGGIVIVVYPIMLERE